MIRVLFNARAEDWEAFGRPLEALGAAAGLALDVTAWAERPDVVAYVVHAPGGPVADFAPFTGLKAVLSLWAGVERIIGNPTIRVPLCRMVDPGMAAGMSEYVAAHVLRYHVGLDALPGQQDGVWRSAAVPPLAAERTVVVLGLGEIGAAVAQTLASLGFRVLGWSRRAKAVAGVETHAGTDGLARVLGEAWALVALLPATPATDNLLDAGRLALLPRGARLVNPGRGGLVDEAALLAALDEGRLAHATLDVFRREPLPADHAFWAHPRVTVTPHVAAATRPATALPVIVENIRRGEAGLPFLHVVDRAAGY